MNAELGSAVSLSVVACLCLFGHHLTSRKVTENRAATAIRLRLAIVNRDSATSWTHHGGDATAGDGAPTV